MADLQKNRPLVSVITVNYNQTETTFDLLESIRQQAYGNLEIIVVDNASKVNPQKEMLARFPEVKFIRSQQNLGFAGGNNLGIAEAKGEYLFFINNDTELTYYCLDRLVDFCREKPGCGAVSPLICFFNYAPGETDIIQYAGMTSVSPYTARNIILGENQHDSGQFLTAAPTAYTHGAAMMVPRKAVDDAGFMPEEYFLYYEELDWCEKIRRAGYEIWLEPTARVYHKESHTVSKMGAMKSYFMFRNRMLFIRRNFPAQRWIFYFYLWLVVVPKTILFHTSKGEKENLSAVFSALAWFFTCKSNTFEEMRGNSTAKEQFHPSSTDSTISTNSTNTPV